MLKKTIVAILAFIISVIFCLSILTHLGSQIPFDASFSPYENGSGSDAEKVTRFKKFLLENSLFNHNIFSTDERIEISKVLSSSDVGLFSDTALKIVSKSESTLHEYERLSNDLNYSYLFSHSPEIPQFIKLADIYRLFHLKGRWLLMQNKYSEVLKLSKFMFESSIKLERSMPSVLIDLLVCSIKKEAAMMTAECLSRIGYDHGSDYRALRATILHSRTNDTAIRNGLIAEYEGLINALDFIERGHAVYYVVDEDTHAGLFETALRKLFFNKEKTIGVAHIIFAETIELIRMPFYKIAQTDAEKYDFTGYMDLITQHPTNLFGGFILSSIRERVCLQLLKRRDSTKAILNGVYVGCLLKEHDTLPLSLESLGLADDILVNPYTGNPMMYDYQKRTITIKSEEGMFQVRL